MRKKSFTKIIALAGLAVFLNAGTAFAGNWEKDEISWRYLKDNGQYAEYEWIQDDDGSWYYFGRFGDMQSNTQIDGCYLRADGKMISEQDTSNPLYGETVYGTCYMNVTSYLDLGDHYKAKVTLYDSSFGTSDDFGHYRVGDKFWIENEGANGTVTSFNMDTGGNIYLEVRYKGTTYDYSQKVTFASNDDGGEALVLRKIKENVDIEISKNIAIIPDERYMAHAISLADFLNSSVWKLIPVFNGTTVEQLYDCEVNYAG